MLFNVPTIVRQKIFKVVNITNLILAFLTVVGLGEASAEGALRVAVAANFMLPMEKITTLFTEKTGIDIQTCYGSSGKLYAQLSQGAPYDLFLSADMKRPEKLHSAGLARPPFRYAAGRVVLWTAQAERKYSVWQQALERESGRIALANPATAPYGRVAVEALQREALWQTLKSRLVYGQSVAQVFQFAGTNSARFAFVALSHALSEKGCRGEFWHLPDAEPVIQGGCHLKSSLKIHAATRFADFLLSDEAASIKKSFGYQP